MTYYFFCLFKQRTCQNFHNQYFISYSEFLHMKVNMFSGFTWFHKNVIMYWLHKSSHSIPTPPQPTTGTYLFSGCLVGHITCWPLQDMAVISNVNNWNTTWEHLGWYFDQSNKHNSGSNASRPHRCSVNIGSLLVLKLNHVSKRSPWEQSYNVTTISKKINVSWFIFTDLIDIFDFHKALLQYILKASC